jgi:Fe-S-cluster-containing hydrogenase component 2
LMACPFGGIHIDAVDRRTVKCDLCDGHAMCVQFCPRDALAYLTPSQLTQALRKKGIQQAVEYIHVITGGSAR